MANWRNPNHRQDGASAIAVIPLRRVRDKCPYVVGLSVVCPSVVTAPAATNSHPA